MAVRWRLELAAEVEDVAVEGVRRVGWPYWACGCCWPCILYIEGDPFSEVTFEPVLALC